MYSPTTCILANSLSRPWTGSDLDTCLDCLGGEERIGCNRSSRLFEVVNWRRLYSCGQAGFGLFLVHRTSAAAVLCSRTCTPLQCPLGARRAWQPCEQKQNVVPFVSWMAFEAIVLVLEGPHYLDLVHRPTLYYQWKGSF